MHWRRGAAAAAMGKGPPLCDGLQQSLPYCAKINDLVTDRRLASIARLRYNGLVVCDRSGPIQCAWLKSAGSVFAIAFVAGLDHSASAADAARDTSEIARKVERGFSNADVKLTLADVQAYFELKNIGDIEIVPGAAPPQVCSYAFIRFGEVQQTVLLARVDSSTDGFVTILLL
jgi:hypothetical protein